MSDPGPDRCIRCGEAIGQLDVDGMCEKCFVSAPSEPERITEATLGEAERDCHVMLAIAEGGSPDAVNGGDLAAFLLRLASDWRRLRALIAPLGAFSSPPSLTLEWRPARRYNIETMQPSAVLHAEDRGDSLAALMAEAETIRAEQGS